MDNATFAQYQQEINHLVDQFYQRIMHAYKTSMASLLANYAPDPAAFKKHLQAFTNEAINFSQKKLTLESYKIINEGLVQLFNEFDTSVLDTANQLFKASFDELKQQIIQTTQKYLSSKPTNTPATQPIKPTPTTAPTTSTPPTSTASTDVIPFKEPLEDEKIDNIIPFKEPLEDLPSKTTKTTTPSVDSEEPDAATLQASLDWYEKMNFPPEVRKKIRSWFHSDVRYKNKPYSGYRKIRREHLARAKKFMEDHYLDPNDIKDIRLVWPYHKPVPFIHTNFTPRTVGEGVISFQQFIQQGLTCNLKNG